MYHPLKASVAALLIVLFFSAGPLHARINPADKAVLNYRQVMFEYDEVKGADYYVVVVSEEGKAPRRFRNESLAFMQEEMFAFGKKYSWYYTAYKKDKSVFKSPAYHFEIKAAFQTSDTWLRTAVTASDTTGYKPGIIFLDYMGMAINRKGEPVWYMPLLKDSLENLKMRNVKLTPAGTITYLDNTDCFEKTINASTIWKAPNNGQVSGDKQEYYHHDFFKMDDGSYITSGYRFVNEPNIYDKSVICKVRYNTIIQYSSEGKVLWWWDESKHIDKKTLYGDSGPTATEVTGTHLNGIAYYKPDDAFIISFRDNSSILKISHTTGEILYNLGDSLKKYYPDEVPFSNQHGPSLLKDGSIVVYNNNLNRTGKQRGPVYPVVKIFRQPSATRQSEKLWDYECYSDKYPEGIFGKEGYASQLPYSNNLLVCMGGANYVFEVTPARKVVWQCTLQRYDDNTKQWTAVNNYRCSYASSLYPSYFTLQHLISSDNNAVSPGFRINNDGSNDQSFTVEINGTVYKTGIKVAAGKNEEIIIAQKPDVKGTAIHVYPDAAKQLQREIIL